ncbi:hypothetical protein GCM10010169_39850 [Micromonospora fulviviridis]|nr:hypothetical protein GCM10010169_39850 [Micromonospora fulviviridis]
MTQRVVITGASAGVGRAVAQPYGARGARLALLARGAAGLAAAERDCRRLGAAEVRTYQVDVADAGAVQRAADDVAHHYGGLDVWVNDAMVSVFAPAWEITAAEFRRVTEVNYLGTVHGTLAALRHMRAHSRGAIVQVGSALAYQGIPLQSAYCASKHAVQGFNDSLRAELLHDCPGVRLSMVQLPAEAGPRRLRQPADRRADRPGDLAGQPGPAGRRRAGPGRRGGVHRPGPPALGGTLGERAQAPRVRADARWAAAGGRRAGPPATLTARPGGRPGIFGRASVRTTRRGLATLSGEPVGRPRMSVMIEPVQLPSPWRDARLTVVVPTYNEAGNLPTLVERLLALPLPGLKVLVADDNSPDGTGEVADKLAIEHPDRVMVVHRPGKEGLGRAYVDGIGRALDDGAEYVAQMDADLSHPPEALPGMLGALLSTQAGVVIGSRYVPGGELDENWPLYRRALSGWANLYVHTLLRVRIRDLTAGFKIWRADALRDIGLQRVQSNGYSFQVEMHYLATKLGHTILEVPIRFEERREGASKMTTATKIESALMPFKLRTRHRNLDT